MNLQYSCKIIEKLLDFGVAEFYVCAGVRNIPLIEAVASIKSATPIVFNHFEERSSAFYALGRIKALGKPVCVLVTSGSAAGELLPATMEGYYSGLPLVLLTADRPARYRGTGAPQTAEQNELFGSYVSRCIDLTDYQDFDLQGISLNMPVHINVCLDEPMLSGKLLPIQTRHSFSQQKHSVLGVDIQQSLTTVNKFLQQAKNPLVLVNKIRSKDRQALIEFLQKVRLPVYIEGLSNHREAPELEALRIHVGDKIWSNTERTDYKIDAVLKIGGTPTLRLWRDLDESRKDVQVLSISDLDFSGSPRTEHIKADLTELFTHYNNTVTAHPGSVPSDQFLSRDRQLYQTCCNLMLEYPQAEQSWFSHLSNLIPASSRVFLGNSLPIRHWDLAATWQPKNLNVEAARGLNGIDGQISTFIGFADEKAVSNWGIFGDLTALYDLAAPWILKQRPDLSVNIVIINNSGGRIFNRVFKGDKAKLVLNEHNLSFEAFAAMWNLDYQRVTNSTDLCGQNVCSRIIEIVPDAEQTQAWQAEFDQL